MQHNELLISLVYNISLILVLVGLYSGVWFKPNLPYRLKDVLDGVLVGLVGLAVMANPWTLQDGIVFDVRSVLLGTAGLFFGFIPAAVAAALTAAYRLWEGGAGAWPGVAVILSSAGLGLLWRRLRPGLPRDGGVVELYLFGVTLHLLMLACMFLMPWPVAVEVVRRISLPVLGVYPVGTVLLALLLVRQRKNSLTVQKLAESEARYKTLFENSNDAVFVCELGPGGIPGRFVEVNGVACRKLGYSREELLRLTPADIDAAEMNKRRREIFEGLALKGEAVFETEHKAKDGGLLHVEISSRVFDHHGRPHVLSTARDISERVRGEEALRESEERYRAVSEYSNNAICIINEAGRMLWVNRRMTEMGGYSEEQYLAAESFARFIAPESLEFVLSNFRKFLAGENYDRHYTFTFVRADGEHRLCEKYMTNYRDRQGKLNLVISMADVTERKQAEERLKKLSDQVPGVIYQYRLYPDGRSCFPYSSSGMNDIYEFRPEELTEDATPVFGNIHPDDLKATSDAIFASARALSIFHWEFRVVLPRQGLRWRMCDAKPERLPDGSTLWYGIITDITDRKNADAERERLLLAIEQAGEMIIVCDPQGLIQYVNPAFEFVTGYTRAEVLGQNPRLLKSGRQDAAFYERLWRLISSGLAWEGRLINKRKDGSLYTEEASISPVKDEAGRIINYVAVKKDISAQIRLEEQFRQSQKMEAVGLLAGGIAHDFNNILTAIKGYCTLVSGAMLEQDPARADMAEIMAAADHATSLTRQLLAFSRRQIISPKVLDLNKVLGDMVKMLRRVIGEDIRLTTRLFPAPCLAKIDPGQMEQVVLNLVLNARDAVSKNGEITLVTSLSDPHLPGEGSVTVEVRDNGCGIRPEDQKQIFEPFFTTKEKGSGSGLGLSVVYGIVEQNSGSIAVESEPGKGSVFRLSFPAAQAAQPAALPARRDVSKTGSETVLFVDDEESLRRLGARLLRDIGYAVITAADGKEALEAAERRGQPVDLLMTDVVMPGMSGRELGREISRRGLARRVLYMSGYTDDAIVKHGVLEPGIAFIYKPFTLESLSVKLREVLDGPPEQAQP